MLFYMLQQYPNIKCTVINDINRDLKSISDSKPTNRNNLLGLPNVNYPRQTIVFTQMQPRLIKPYQIAIQQMSILEDTRGRNLLK